MENNRRWLVYANESRCNHVKAFSEIGYVSWYPHNRKFKVGDFVYMFLSIDRNVRYKAKVTAVGVPRTDQKYWSVPTTNSLTCKLDFVAEYNGDFLVKMNLKNMVLKVVEALNNQCAETKNCLTILKKYLPNKKNYEVLDYTGKSSAI